MFDMNELFLNILNMSITASWLVLAVILIRLIFKKAPKAIFVVMWALVGIRLICPFSVESVLSLIPSKETVPPDIITAVEPVIYSGIGYIDLRLNPVISESFSPNPGDSANPLQIVTAIAAVIWLCGIAAMLVYTLISYLKIRRNVCEAIPHKDSIMLCDKVETPFILGLIKPKIYLPSAMNEGDMQYVIAHEKAHLKRCDHLWKPLGFLLLTLYWFNPVLWVAYILLCRDIELACDEKVIKELGVDIKKAYSQALINCAVKHKAIAACPLAFGETGVKQRIKSVLNYKKPAFWLIALALVASIVVGICFLTDPIEKNNFIINQSSGSDTYGLSAEIISSDFSQPSPYIEVKIKNKTLTPFLGGEEFYIYKQIDGEWVDCRSLDPYVWNAIGYILKSYSTFTHKYSLNYISIDGPGLYRFETAVTKDGDEHKEAEVWIEFEVTEGMPKTSLQLLAPIEMMYDAGMYSYVQTVDSAPSYLLGSNMLLHVMTKDSLITELGVAEETELNNESFDSRFGSNSWFGEYSIKDIKKNNRRMWELYLGNGSERFSELYILLQQKDGSFILGYGYYNCQSENPRNSDDSHIRWLYKMSADASLGDITLSQVAADGTMLFYGEATDENEYPKHYSSIVQLNNDELNSLLKTLEEQKWIYDGLVDRLSFNFDGQLKYDNKWIYFGYEQRVIYCDEYFCEVSSEIIESIKTFELQAQTFRPIKANETVYIYPDSPDPVTPSLVLNKDDGTFTFTYSVYSSYLARGKYEYVNDFLYLETFDNKYSYVFSVNNENNTLEFIAEKSSPIPEYKYSAYAKKALSPVPGGAIFVAQETNRLPVDQPRYGTRTFDIDGDGEKETCVLSQGSTADGIVFSVTAWEKDSSTDKPKYHNTFGTSGTQRELSFTDENGNVQIKAVYSDKECETEYYDIGIDENGWLYVAFGNGKKRFGYHGEQGVQGYLHATKTFSGSLYKSSVAWANYYSDYAFFAGCLNSVKLLINSVQHLPVYKFETYDELKNFKKNYKDAFTFDEGWGETPSFNEATKNMDKEFFEENTLFLVYVQASNCTQRFGLNSVYNDGENLCIHIEQTNNPEVVETMMAGWFILVPIEKADIQSCTSFDADLNNLPI